MSHSLGNDSGKILHVAAGPRMYFLLFERDGSSSDGIYCFYVEYIAQWQCTVTLFLF